MQKIQDNHEKEMKKKEQDAERIKKDADHVITLKLIEVRKEYEPMIAKKGQEVENKKKENDDLEQEVRNLELQIRKQEAINKMKQQQLNAPKEDK